MVRPIPEGYATITPYLVVPSADEFVNFVVDAFAADVNHLLRREDGSVYSAEVQIGDSRIMLGEARDEWPATQAGFYMYVPDCDATFAKALQAGGTSIMEPADMTYGDRHGGVADPAGNHWWIATHIEDVTPEESLRRHQEGA